MITYTTTIHKFGANGDKTGWTYIEIPEDLAQQLIPGNKKSFRVKGKLDNYSIHGVAVLPMGNGSFLMALNATMRKGIGKRNGAMVQVALELDATPLKVSAALLACLEEEPDARSFFDTLSPSHQRYFSNWIEEAKTETTKIKRLTACISALARRLEYGPMLREQKAKNK